MRLGQILRKWRRAMELKQVDVAANIGIEVRVLSRIEGGGAMDGETLARILAWMMAPNSEQVPEPARTAAGNGDES